MVDKKHEHTCSPPRDAPWCEVCNALLTWAVIADESGGPTPSVGIPTVYKHRQYRSRLEARWACFFDLLGWHYEYEPCDLEGWIPDFVLCEAEPVFVEVKPVTLFPVEVAAKLDATSCLDDVLIVGVRLLEPRDNYGEMLALGWLREFVEDCASWDYAPLGVWSHPPPTKPRVGFCHALQSFRDRITGMYDGGCHGALPLNTVHVWALWAEAGNVTQWQKRRGARR